MTMPEPITQAEREAFHALCPVSPLPSGVVDVGGRLTVCPRTARILAALLVEAAAQIEDANPNRDGDLMDPADRPTF